MEGFSSDIELIRFLHEGNGRAYSVIYERFVAQLTYFARSITGSREAAEEIASESFLKVFRRKAEFASIAELKNFLFRIASNAALDYAKMQSRYRNHIGEWSQTQDHFTDDIHYKYIQSEAVAQIQRELQKLPPQVRQVVRMSLFEDRSLQEIADEMKIAYKTIKNHKTRGLAMLREALSLNEGISPLVLIAALKFFS